MMRVIQFLLTLFVFPETKGMSGSSLRPNYVGLEGRAHAPGVFRPFCAAVAINCGMR